MQRIPHHDCPNLMFANEPQQTPQILAPALAPQRQQWLCGIAQRVRKSDTYPHLTNIQSHHSPRNHDPPHLSPSGTSLRQFPSCYAPPRSRGVVFFGGKPRKGPSLRCTPTVKLLYRSFPVAMHHRDREAWFSSGENHVKVLR